MNTEEKWLREKAAIEDTSFVSVGGLAMALSARPSLPLIPDDVPDSVIELAHATMLDAHDGQKRFGGEPFRIHPEAVADKLPRRFKPIGLMHDVMEDSPKYPLSRMQTLFPAWITERLRVLTKLPNENYDDYILRIIATADLAVWSTKVEDLKNNLSSPNLSKGSLRDKQRLALRLLGEVP